MTTFEKELLTYLRDITQSQERIAAADERRNELLEAEAAERRAVWAKQDARDEARTAALLKTLEKESPNA